MTKPETRPARAGTRRTHIVWQPREVQSLLRVARTLVDSADAPFSARSMWLSAWYARFGTRPVAVCVYQDGEPVGAAFLAIQRRGPIRSVVLAGHGPGDHGRLPLRGSDGTADDTTDDTTGATTDLAAIVAQGIVEVLDHLRGPWRLELTQLPVGDPVAKALTALLPGARIEAAQASPRLVFGPDRRPERVLTGATRREARRGYRRLDEAGVAVEIRRIVDPAEVRATLPQLVAVHRDRDHSLGRRSDLDPEPRRAFFGEIVVGLADAGTLDLWVIRLDGAIGAFFIGARDGACYRIIDGRMSGLWPTASPALILRTEMTASLLADLRIMEIDYMRGVLAHKTQDATDIVPAEAVLAESSPLVRHAVQHWGHLKLTIRERLSPTARGWIRSVRSTLPVRRTDHRVQDRP